MWRRLASWSLPGSLLVVALALPVSAAAQLISPGKLSAPHAFLDGIEHCTQCHELHKRGISPARCLACHTILAKEIRAGRGFHGSLAEKNCATCHKEHFGVHFDLVRLNTATFDHSRTGFVLVGKHAQIGCRDCHKPQFITDPAVRANREKYHALGTTYLGLSTQCASCHESDSPHGTQFAGEACSQCHDARGWKPAREFDHDRTSFPLTGAHRDVACSKCHEATPRPGSTVPYVRYTGIASGRCEDCHEDPHHGTMRGTCTSCHNTTGWYDVNRHVVETSFDHSTTGFPLVGDHARIPCASCHVARTIATLTDVHIRFKPGTLDRSFPIPVSGNCTTCHVDAHHGVFARTKSGGNCASCHSQSAWLPVDYDVARHNRDTSFKLVGAHVVVSCDACHERTSSVPDFQMPDGTCADCHQVQNPHGDQFKGKDCSACHTVDSFRIVHFNHDDTRFPLRGAHAKAPCSACHKPEPKPGGGTMIRYRPLGTKCVDCHGGSA